VDLGRRSDEDLRPSVRGKAHEHVPFSFLEKKFKPIDACSGYSVASLCLPGHLIPATFFNDFSSLPATYCLEFFEFRFRVRLLHKLRDADRRLTRQDLFGHRLGRACVGWGSGGPTQLYAVGRPADEVGAVR